MVINVSVGVAAQAVAVALYFIAHKVLHYETAMIAQAAVLSAGLLWVRFIARAQPGAEQVTTSRIVALVRICAPRRMAARLFLRF